jgi:hypothetical protein
LPDQPGDTGNQRQYRRGRQSARPAGDLITAVVENMRRNLETLKYSTLAPSRYVVYVHPAEFARLEGIIPILQEETIRALREALQQLNNPSRVRAFSSRFFGAAAGPKCRRRRAKWQVEFLADPTGDSRRGRHSDRLGAPAAGGAGARVGERTRRITTSRTARADDRAGTDGPDARSGGAAARLPESPGKISQASTPSTWRPTS